MSIRAYNDERWLLDRIEPSDVVPSNGCDVPAPTWVYYLYAEDLRLLYVGVAAVLSRRITEHRRTKPWWRDVHALLAHLICCRPHAMDLEAHDIRYDKPEHNLWKPRPFRQIEIVQEAHGFLTLVHSQGEI